MRRVYSLCIITSLMMCLLSFGIHRMTKTEEKQIKIGFIFVGDEITPYTNNLIKARDHVIEVYGEQIEGYGLVNTDAELMSGDFVKVRITEALEYDLIGEIVS